MTAIFRVLAALISVICVVALMPQNTLLAAEILPEIRLTVPQNQQYREYLGLSRPPGEEFSLAEVDGDILLIELFSMYCPYCQAEAPRINEFHALARELAKEGIEIKMVGLGASNTQFEVDYFRDTYDIEFPLFPDKTLAMYKKLGGEGTPGFIGCILEQGKQPTIVLRESGGFDSPEGFLTLLLQKAGLK